MKKHSKASAFSLVEVSVALGIAGFCLISIFGLLPVALGVNSANTEQTTASLIATAILADLRSAPSSASNSTVYSVALSAGSAVLFLDENASVTAAGSATAKYKATVVIGNSVNRLATPVCIQIAWPPVAAVPFGTFEINAALNRN